MTSRSKPSAAPLARRHVRERGEKILVDRIGLAVEMLFQRHVLLEAAALLVGVGQFAEGVGEFDAAGVELEALARPEGRRGESRASAASLAG